jgi:hypothetical protein
LNIDLAPSLMKHNYIIGFMAALVKDTACI